MNWDDLRIFLSLHRDGTFAATGRTLGVNPTTAARRLTALEEAVGAQLFTRTRDGLVPTAAAEEMLAPAEVIERQLVRIHRSVGGGDARLAGRVRLNATQNFATNFLVEHLGVFRRRHPDIEIELTACDHMVDPSRGEADILVRHRSPNSGPGVETTGHVEVVARRVAPVAFAVFASKAYLERAGYPKHDDDVSGHDAILPRNDARHIPAGSWSRRVAGRMRTPLRSDDLGTMQAACMAGFGLCALPCLPRLYQSNLMRVSDNIDIRDNWLIMPGDLRRVARVRALWDYLVSVFEEWGPLLSGEVTPEGHDARASAS